MRLISGLRYIDDEAESCVKNFFTTVCDNLSSSSDETTGKIAVEYDFNGSTMGYASYTIDPNQAVQTLLMVLVPEKSLILISDLDRQYSNGL